MAAALEMELHEVRMRSKIGAKQLKSTARDETAKLAAKVDGMERELLKLAAVDSSLRQTIRSLLESRQQLQSQLEHHTVPKEDWHQANQTIAALRAELKDGFIAKEEEISKLRGALQVPLCIHINMKRNSSAICCYHVSQIQASWLCIC
jgi:predicted RNase H-like nuclease (RuvC/YqgF family)